MKLDSTVELWCKWNDDWCRSVTSRDVEKRGNRIGFEAVLSISAK